MRIRENEQIWDLHAPPTSVNHLFLLCVCINEQWSAAGKGRLTTYSRKLSYKWRRISFLCRHTHRQPGAYTMHAKSVFHRIILASRNEWQSWHVVMCTLLWRLQQLQYISHTHPYGHMALWEWRGNFPMWRGKSVAAATYPSVCKTVDSLMVSLAHIATPSLCIARSAKLLGKTFMTRRDATQTQQLDVVNSPGKTVI